MVLQPNCNTEDRGAILSKALSSPACVVKRKDKRFARLMSNHYATLKWHFVEGSPLHLT